MNSWKTWRVRRVAVGGAALAMLGAGAVIAPPSHAEEPLPAVLQLSGWQPQGALPRAAGALTEAHYRTYELGISGERPDKKPITGVEVVIDTSGAKQMAEFRFRSECKVVGDVATCPVKMPDGLGDPEAYVPFFARPKLGTTVQDKGVITYRTEADNAAMAEGPGKLDVTVADKDQLVVGGFPASYGVDVPTGGRAPIPFDVTNIGAKTLRGLRVTISGFDGDGTVVLPGDHKNCWYWLKDPKNPKSPRTGAVCEFNTPILPGTTYEVSPALASALVRYTTAGRAEISVEEANGKQARHVQGKSAPAKLATKAPSTVPRVPRPVDPDHIWDHYVILGFHSPKGPDLAAVAPTVNTQVGKEIGAEVGIKNRSGKTVPAGQTTVYAEIPKGLTVVRAGEGCEKAAWRDEWTGMAVPTGTVYRCGGSAELPSGKQQLYAFTLKATEPLANVKGVVLAVASSSKTNSTARLTVTAKAAPGGSTTGGTGGSGTSGGSVAGGSAGGSTSGSSSSGGSSATGGTGSTSGGNLAGTGSAMLVPAIAAGSAVALGALALVLVRRRRVR
ncbi:hypothetical protein [Streptomyces sp. NPDC020681]|uniref:hypothetical protein n=1 Tax=Streptomyces sp. NPDC020681 TaxID=3365083 RepID=UPI0037998348